MRYTVSQAAKAVGKSKATIHRAIQAGRISAVRDDATGAFQVDAAELHRVFPPVPDSPHDAAESPHETTHDASRDEGIRARLLAAETRISEMQEATRLRDDTIADLRARLDQREADHRQALDRLAVAQERIAALLTDQRPIAPPVPARHGWWPWRRARIDA